MSEPTSSSDTITLERFAYLPTATLGWLNTGALKLATLERPWLRSPDGPGGKLRESCIPDGEYTVRPHSSEKFPNTYAIVNEALGVYYQTRPEGQVWGRTAILIHIGNFVADVIGCVAVGQVHSGMGSVSNSTKAMDALRRALGSDRYTMIIRPTGAREI